MKHSIKRLVALGLAMTMAMSTSLVALADGWVTDEKGKWYQEGNSYPSNGWKDIDGKRYYFNAEGYVMTGWIQANNAWYYMDPDGAMHYGWLLDTDGSWFWLDEKTGQMATGWKNIGGLNYYLKADGRMQTAGWLNDNGTWHYMDANGAAMTDWQLINGTWYWLGTSGSMEFGKKYIGDGWYYLEEDRNSPTFGGMVYGWRQFSDGWYYFDPNQGGKAATGDVYIDGYSYKFADDTGLWLSEVLYKGTWYGEQDPKKVGTNKDGTYKDGVEAKVNSTGVTYYDGDGKQVKNPGNSLKNEVNTWMDKIPDGLLTKFINIGGTVRYYMDDTTAGEATFIDDAGEKFKSEIAATVDGKKIKFAAEPSNVLFGFGQFIDIWASTHVKEYKDANKIRPSQTQEFRDIYAREISNLYCDDDCEIMVYDECPETYFASCWALYTDHDKSFKESCPESYEFVKKVSSATIKTVK